jgi:hypothetical protein
MREAHRRASTLHRRRSAREDAVRTLVDYLNVPCCARGLEPFPRPPPGTTPTVSLAERARKTPVANARGSYLRRHHATTSGRTVALDCGPHRCPMQLRSRGLNRGFRWPRTTPRRGGTTVSGVRGAPTTKTRPSSSIWLASTVWLVDGCWMSGVPPVAICSSCAGTSTPRTRPLHARRVPPSLRRGGPHSPVAGRRLDQPRPHHRQELTPAGTRCCASRWACPSTRAAELRPPSAALGEVLALGGPGGEPVGVGQG